MAVRKETIKQQFADALWNSMFYLADHAGPAGDASTATTAVAPSPLLR